MNLLQVTPTYQRTANQTARIVVLRGGARSGKSFAMIQKIAIWLYTGHISGDYVPEGSFTVIRLTFPALRTTVYREFIEFLFQTGWHKYIEHRKSVHEFHYKKRFVAFTPADDEQKLRGRKHTFVLLEECNDVSFDVFHQINMRTDRQIFCTTNPSGHPWVRTEIEEKAEARGDVFVDVSTYHDNPFLPESITAQIEALKYTDESLYRIYSLGQWTDLKGLIFPDFEIVDKVPEGVQYYGLDMGWNAPSAFVRVTLAANSLYIENPIYAREMPTRELAEKIVKIVGARRVFCDSAEPRTIYDLRRYGVNAKAAKKGRDSIRQGLTFMRQHHIFIHAESLDAIKEFHKYKWKEDRDGRIIDEPISDFNHVADASRYAVSHTMNKRVRII